jgi:hypothetical protein
MRLSPDGLNVLGGVQGVVLNGAMVMPNAGLSSGGADFVDEGIVFYGGWNTAQLVARLAAISPAVRMAVPGASAALAHAQAHLEALQGPGATIVAGSAGPGLYGAALVNPQPSYLEPAGWQTVIGLWTDGRGRRLTAHTDGARDSDGNYWPDRVALGSSRQGDWLFCQTPDYTTLIVRSAGGIESRLALGAYFKETVTNADDGLLLLNAGGPCYEVNFDRVTASPSRVALPTAGAVVAMGPAVGGRIAWAGYQPGFGLCVGWLDEAPLGSVLSGDGRDFDPMIAARFDASIVVAAGENQGETVPRIYQCDAALMNCTINGRTFPLPLVNLTTPPLDVPAFTHNLDAGVVFPSR